MEVQKKDYVTIARFFYENLIEDRVYLEAIEKVLSDEILQHCDKINKIYDEQIDFHKKLLGIT